VQSFCIIVDTFDESSRQSQSANTDNLQNMLELDASENNEHYYRSLVKNEYSGNQSEAQPMECSFAQSSDKYWPVCSQQLPESLEPFSFDSSHNIRFDEVTNGFGYPPPSGLIRPPHPGNF